MASWAGTSFSSGSYTIALTGAATFSSAPCGGQGAVCAGPPPPNAIVGTNGPNVITPAFNSTFGPKPTAGDDIIFGLGGPDTIDGGGGNDIICAGAGPDAVQGGAGTNTTSGDAGTDNCDNPNPPNPGDFGCEA